MGKEGKYGAFFLALALFLPFLALETDRRMTVALPADGPAEVEQEQETKFIALTFDDGPRRSTTGPLLDGLAQRGVPATFFLIGEQVPGNEDIVRRMEAEGHQIGIHTYDHKCLTALNAADFSAQVDRSRQLLGEILGRENFLLRPPYGMVDAGQCHHPLVHRPGGLGRQKCRTHYPAYRLPGKGRGHHTASRYLFHLGGGGSGGGGCAA